MIEDCLFTLLGIRSRAPFDARYDSTASWSHAPISRACAIDGISRRLTSTLYPAGASSLISPSNRILPSQLLCILLRCRLLFIPLVPLLFKIALLYGLLPRALKQSLAIWRIDDNPR